MIGNIDNAAANAATNDALTSPEVAEAAQQQIVVLPAKKEYEAPSFTDEEMFIVICKSVFMVIRE